MHAVRVLHIATRIYRNHTMDSCKPLSQCPELRCCLACTNNMSSLTSTPLVLSPTTASEACNSTSTNSVVVTSICAHDRKEISKSKGTETRDAPTIVRHKEYHYLLCIPLHWKIEISMYCISVTILLQYTQVILV